MRFGSITKVLAECSPKYYGILECDAPKAEGLMIPLTYHTSCKPYQLAVAAQLLCKPDMAHDV